MSWEHFVGPAEPGAWTLDTDALVAAIQTRWPGIEVKVLDPALYLIRVEWVVFFEPPSGPGRDEVFCYFYDDGQSLGFESDRDLRFIGYYAQIALWYRSVVPPEHRLFLANPGYQIEVQPSSPVMELVRGLGY